MKYLYVYKNEEAFALHIFLRFWYFLNESVTNINTLYSKYDRKIIIYICDTFKQKPFNMIEISVLIFLEDIAK